MSGSPYIYQEAYGDGLEAINNLHGGLIGPHYITLGAAVLAGDYLFVEYSCREDQSLAPTIADDAGNTWTAIYSSIGYAMWYCVAKAWPAGNNIYFGNTSFDQSARAVEVTNFPSAPTITVAHGTGTTASVTGGGLTASAPLSVSTDWAAAIVEFVGPSGSQNFYLLMLLNGTEISGGVGYNSLPNFWNDLFAGDSSTNNAAFILVYGPEYGVTVAAVVTDVSERAGLLSSQIDVSLLTSTNLKPTDLVMGYLIDHPTPAADIIKMLMRAYFFDACESGGKMKFVPRGLAAALTIPEADLGLVKDACKIEEQIGQEQDLPMQFTTTFNDPTLDYQQNKQLKRRSQRIITTRQQGILEIPMTMTSDWGRQTAEKALYLSWLERNSYKLNLWRASYLLLDPTDVIEFIYEALTFQIRIAENSDGQGFSTALQGLSEYAQLLVSSATGGAAIGFIPNPVQALGPTLLFLFDIPLLRDVDSNPSNTGFYFAMSSPLPTWGGGLLYDSTDDSNFTEDASSNLPVTFGYAVNALAAPPRSPWIWDQTDTLTVNLTVGSFVSDTQLNVLNGTNAVLVGQELIQFTTAVHNANGSWTLSGLLRGRRGTEWACGTHVVGELVVVPATGMQRVQEPLSVIAMQRWFKGVTAGQDPTLVPPVEFTIIGNDLKPYAPVHFTGARDGSGNLTINWIRRTRVGWRSLSQDPVPLSEDSESYSIDILNGVTVVRTITSTSPTASYTAAQQTTDFGSAQAAVSLKAYQISAQVGRGFAEAATV